MKTQPKLSVSSSQQQVSILFQSSFFTSWKPGTRGSFLFSSVQHETNYWVQALQKLMKLCIEVSHSFKFEWDGSRGINLMKIIVSFNSMGNFNLL